MARNQAEADAEFFPAVAQHLARQANREIVEWNATHPPRYLVVLKPVMGRRVRYYERHEWEWRNGEYVQVPQFQARPNTELLMRDKEWAEKIAAEIGGKVVDTLRD